MFWNRKKTEPAPKTKAPADIYSMMNGMGADSADMLRMYIDENAVPMEAPHVEGHAMDSADSVHSSSINYGTVNPVIFAHYVSTGQFIGYPAMAVMAQHWLIRKGCESKPRDAVRKWYDIAADGGELTPGQIKAIEKLDRKFSLKNNIIEGVTLNNIFGIRHILFKHTNPDFDYSRPFNPDEFRNGGYAGISQIDPLRLTPELKNDDIMDPISITYMEPTWWLVNGKRIHKSHMVVLTGDMVPDLLKPTYRYGGVSMVQKAFERVYAAERTANEAPQLAMTKRLVWRKADLDQMAAKPEKFGRAMQKLVEFRNNYGVQLLGKEEEMGQLDTSLTDLDAVIMGQYQLVCSIFAEPASKLMGTGSQGFSTGDADIDYRIESLEELQANEMTDIVDAHYRRLIPSYAADLQMKPDASIYPEWLPLRVMSDGDVADINLKNRQADQLLFQMQAIDNFEVRQRLIDDPNSGFNALEMPAEEEDDDGEETGSEANAPEV
jgi:phage-related protein (TIGR01555 family)